MITVDWTAGTLAEIHDAATKLLAQIETLMEWGEAPVEGSTGATEQAEARREALLRRDWGDEWNRLPEAPMLVPRPPRRQSGVGRDGLERVLDLIADSRAEGITVKEIHDALGLSVNSIQQATKALYDQGRVSRTTEKSRSGSIQYRYRAKTS